MTSRLVFVLVLGCTVAAAEPCPQLAHEQQRAHRWDVTWGVLLTSAFVVQGAAALTPPLPRAVRVGAAIGAGKSFLGAAGHWVLPMRLGDGCDVEHAATVERQNFWLLHIGAFVVNGAGFVAEAELTDWQHAAVSTAVGYTVGLVQVYTMPRIHTDMTATVTPTAGGWSVSLAGAF
jgi:hypothetical protein